MSEPSDRFESKHFRLEPLADGVYAAIARRDTGGEFVNAGLVDLGDEVLAVDSFLLPQAARDLIRAADQVIGKPIRWLLNTHFHSDHIHGNYVFPKHTTIISTPATRRTIQKNAAAFLESRRASLADEIARLKQQRDEAQDEDHQRVVNARVMLQESLAEAIGEIVVRPPQVTFESRLTLHGAWRVAEIAACGHGHTPGDAYLYLPEDRVLFVGDLLVVQTQPFMIDSDPARWRLALGEIKALGVDKIVPGHGPVGAVADVDVLLAYFDLLNQRVAEVVSRGGTAEDAQQVPAPPGLPVWGEQAFSWNMRHLFEQYTR